MITKRLWRSLLLVSLLLGWIGGALPLDVAAGTPTGWPALMGITAAGQKIAAPVWLATDAGQTADTLVLLAEQADLSPAHALDSKAARGQFVYATLRETAQRAQAPLRAWLDARGVPYRAFYIVNAVQVKADRDLLLALAARPEVGRIVANPKITLPPLPAEPAPALHTASDVAWGVPAIHAPELWALGVRGQGLVIAGQDTGYDWQHPALRASYRGWDGATASHDYHWHDAIHSGGGTCGADAPAPCDDHGHGTHTLGTMTGDGGPDYRIGVAPDAQWIGCRNMDQGNGTPARYIECFEFFLAPYPVGETPADGNADPTRAPDIINNSWSCPPSEGCDWQSLQATVEAVRAAGIMVVAAAGNAGSSCSSVSDPIAIYDAVYTIGATGSNGALASFSSRGPVTVDGSGRLKPDLTAPGVGVYSTVRGTGYGYMSGTSMASPHVAGAVALLWSARPELRGDIAATEALLNATATPVSTTLCSSPQGVPNNLYGGGRLDVLAAVEAVAGPPGYLTGIVRDTTTLAPLADVAVEAVSSVVTLTTTTDAHGLYHFALLAETYTVSVSLPPYAGLSLPGVTVTAAQTTTLNVDWQSPVPGNSLVAEIIAQVQPDALYNYVGDLSGEWPVLVSGELYTIATRYSYSGDPISKALQFTQQHLAALGLETSYHSYTTPTNPPHIWRNLIAEQPGNFQPERLVLLTAHLDSTARTPANPMLTAPGADDNASGVAAVLVAADILSQYEWPYTLRYVLFTGEEQGMWGSAAYAADAASAGEEIVAVVNLDMLAYDSDGLPRMGLHARTDASGERDRRIAAQFVEVVTGHGLDLQPVLVQHPTGSSDHASFWNVGYPAILVIEDMADFTPYYHTTGDRLATLNMPYFTEMVRATVGTAVHLAGLAAFEVTPQQPGAGQVVTLTGMTTLPGSPTYTWTFAGGDVATGQVVTHVFPFDVVTHTYGVTLTVTTPTDNVAVNEAVLVPGAAAVVLTSARVTAGYPLTLTGAVLPAVSGLTYTWNLGDGSPLRVGNPVTHIYAAEVFPQPYTVTLTATHATGAISASKVVWVEAPHHIYLPAVVRTGQAGEE